MTDADDSAPRLPGPIGDRDERQVVVVGEDPLIAGRPLTAPALNEATTSPHPVVAGTPRAHVLDLMTAWRVSAIPEVDAAGRVQGVHALSDVVGPSTLPNNAVVMAGGLFALAKTGESMNYSAHADMRAAPAE